jgi:toxin secretion/phage lysis holin
MKENFLQILFATVAGAIVAYLNVLLVPFIVLIIVMLIDYGTGMAQAYVSHSLNSRIGVVGIIKKIGYIVAVTVGIVADYLISSALTQVGIDIKINYCIGMIVTIWFIINELISVLENLAEIGIPLPKFLVAIIKRLKVVVENKTDESEDNKNE